MKERLQLKLAHLIIKGFTRQKYAADFSFNVFYNNYNNLFYFNVIIQAVGKALFRAHVEGQLKVLIFLFS